MALIRDDEKKFYNFGTRTPLRFGVGIPGMENTVVGMMDWRSSLVVDVDATDVVVVVMIPPPECKPGWAIWRKGQKHDFTKRRNKLVFLSGNLSSG
jgi:hypothetical protein